ncbi:MAG: hypothetical protein WD005_02590 [Haliea sp.]
MEFSKLKRGPFDLKNKLRTQQDRLAKMWGRPTNGMRTNYKINNTPVIFIHNPQTGGTSLGKALGVRRLSHAWPNDRLSEKSWLNTYSICAVRDPYKRFLSSYYATIDPSHPVIGLTKAYGPEIKTLSPFQFLDLLSQDPKYGGYQVNWATYRSTAKPTADMILRFEEIRSWADQLKSAGIVDQGFELPHKNQKPNKPKSESDLLGIDDEQIPDLKVAVYNHFKCDYDAFSEVVLLFRTGLRLS